MTSMSGSPAPDGDEERPPGGTEQDGGPGVELGMSDGTGGTFEPEEDPVEDVESDS